MLRRINSQNDDLEVVILRLKFLFNNKENLIWEPKTLSRPIIRYRSEAWAVGK